MMNTERKGFSMSRLSFPLPFQVPFEVVIFVCVWFGVFLTRLPFLGPGYGADWDAWAMVNTARTLSTTGTYVASRLPGYPVPEIAESFLWRAGPVAIDGATACIGALGTAFFALTLRNFRSPDFVAGAFAVAFTPVIYVSSTTSLDYVWALSFLLASYYYCLRRQLIVSGVLLGLAIGSRITSGAMLFPLVLTQLEFISIERDVTAFLKISLPAVVVGIAAFLPVVMRYGPYFLTFSENGYPPIWAVVANMTVFTWGSVGCVALLGAVTVIVTRGFYPSSTASITRALRPRIVWAWLLAMTLYLIAFLRLPHKPGYLLPLVPFVILFLGRWLDRQWFIGFCSAIIVSPLILSVLSVSLMTIYGGPTLSRFARERTILGQGFVIDPLKGPILSDHSERTNDAIITDAAVRFGSGLQHQSIIVAGRWLTEVRFSAYSHDSTNVEYVDDLRQSDAVRVARFHLGLYYLPGIDIYSRAETGISLQKLGGKPLPITIPRSS